MMTLILQIMPNNETGQTATRNNQPSNRFSHGANRSGSGKHVKFLDSLFNNNNVSKEDLIIILN